MTLGKVYEAALLHTPKISYPVKPGKTGRVGRLWRAFRIHGCDSGQLYGCLELRHVDRCHRDRQGGRACQLWPRT